MVRTGLNTTKKNYFYTVLFLDNYYPEKEETVLSNLYQQSKTEKKLFSITNTTNTANVKWLDKYTLWVRPGITSPLTLEMWNEQDKPIFYCPILKAGIDSISVGQVVAESNSTFKLYFDEENNPPPKDGETSKLAIKNLPNFDLQEEQFSIPGASLEENLTHQTGLAIVFRRNSIDALFDLIAEFDESYWHSLVDTFDQKLLTRMSCYKDAYFMTKYTSDLEDVLNRINVDQYEVKYSWKNI